MLLKRMYKQNEDGSPGELDYISLADTGKAPEQHFSTGLVTELLTKGFMEITDQTLIFHVHPEDLIYEIKRTPGRYCLHCAEKLIDDAGGEMARLHVAQYHALKHSPDPNNPAGYEAINYFDCVLNEEQHAEYQKQGNGVVARFPRKEGLDNG